MRRDGAEINLKSRASLSIVRGHSVANLPHLLMKITLFCNKNNGNGSVARFCYAFLAVRQVGPIDVSSTQRVPSCPLQLCWGMVNGTGGC